MAAVVQTMRPGPIGQPDIDYAPNLDKYRARVKRRTENEALESTLPPDFPSQLDSPLVWDGATVGSTFNWVHELNDVETDEIERALEHFKCRLILMANALECI